MKKTLITLTSLLLICIIMIGCNSTDATISTSQDLNKNLNILSNTVRRLDTIDNAYLMSSDLYSTKINQLNNITSEPVRLANSTNVTVTDSQEIKDQIKNILDNNNNCILYCTDDGCCTICDEQFVCDNDGICNNCNTTYNCDPEGNCYSCNNTLNCDDNNNCLSCNSNCTTQDNIQINKDTLDSLISISNINTKNIDISNNSQDVSGIMQNNDVTNTTIDDTSSHIDTLVEPQETIRILYYTEDTFNPQHLRYQPRYISSFDYSIANSNLDNYVAKLSKLYAMTADVIEANNTLANHKTSILNNISDTQDLNNCILTGNCTPTHNQVLALKNYIADIRNTILNLKNCNGDLSNEINKISSANTGISNSIEVTNSNYLRILNQIDTRISYHENAIATLEQIKFLLEDAKNNSSDINNTTQDPSNPIIEILPNDEDTIEEIEDLIEDGTAVIDEDNNAIIIIDDSTSSNSTNQDNEVITELNDNTANRSLNLIPDQDFENGSQEREQDKNSIDSLDQSNDNTNLDYVSSDNPDINLDNSEELDNNSSNEDAMINEDTSISDTNADNPDVLDDENLDNEDITTNTNIDTYNQDTFNNLDLLDNNTTNDTIDDKQDILTELENNDNIINNDTNIGLTSDANNISTNSSTTAPQMVGGGVLNGIISNNPNTIISQNNINETDTGNSYYHYDNDGNLYNNTNGFESGEISNANLKNNNVNTYQYNTILDSINRGTIDNGINNL